VHHEELPGVTLLSVEGGDELRTTPLRLRRCQRVVTKKPRQRSFRLTSDGRKTVAIPSICIDILVTSSALRRVASVIGARPPAAATTGRHGCAHGLHGKVIRGRSPSKGNGKVIFVPYLYSAHSAQCLG
jgi:hypothetical protein